MSQVMTSQRQPQSFDQCQYSKILTLTTCQVTIRHKSWLLRALGSSRQTVLGQFTGTISLSLSRWTRLGSTQSVQLPRHLQTELLKPVWPWPQVTEDSPQTRQSDTSRYPGTLISGAKHMASDLEQLRTFHKSYLNIFIYTCLFNFN